MQKVMMLDVFRSLVWLLLVAVIGLGAVFIVANAIVSAQVSSVKPLLVRDTIGAGSHNLAGSIMVPSTCDQVIINVEQTSKRSYAIVFKTWKEPSTTACLDQKTTREFHAVVFAPSIGVSFTASFDGVPVPIAVIPDTPLPY